MPVYRSHHVQAISFYRPDTGETAQFNLIEGATFEVVSKPLMQVIQAGKKITVQELVTLKVTVFDFAFIDMLTTWQDNYIPVQAVAAGSPNLQWYESGYLRITSEMKASEGLTKLTLELEAVQVLNNKNIHMNENLLAYLGWADANGDGVADGYLNVNSVLTNLSFANSVQQFTSGVGGTSDFRSSDVVFPIDGVGLTQSVNYIQNDEPSSRIQVKQRDYSFATIATSTSLLYVAIGIQVNLFKTLPELFSLGQSYFYRSPATGQIVRLSNPALTTNGSLTPGTKFMNW